MRAALWAVRVGGGQARDGKWAKVGGNQDRGCRRWGPGGWVGDWKVWGGVIGDLAGSRRGGASGVASSAPHRQEDERASSPGHLNMGTEQCGVVLSFAARGAGG